MRKSKSFAILTLVITAAVLIGTAVASNMAFKFNAVVRAGESGGTCMVIVPRYLVNGIWVQIHRARWRMGLINAPPCVPAAGLEVDTTVRLRSVS